MGQCLCKDGIDTEVCQNSNGCVGVLEEGGDQAQHPVQHTAHHTVHHPVHQYRHSTGVEEEEQYTQKQVDSLVLETLLVIRTIVELEQDPPLSLIKLNTVAEREEGWLQLVRSFVNVIPVSDPLGPAVMSLLLDDCPLPTRETAVKCLDLLDTLPSEYNTAQHRNITIVLGCLAEKLAGPRSVALLTDRTLDYLFSNLEVGSPPSLILFSLIALEKFTQTSENKAKIRRRFSVIQRPEDHPLVKLEANVNSETDFVMRQVGFCAQWSLDNLFPVDNREYSYLSTDTQNINMMLNSNDVSEYLKLGPNGLVARCDASSFESVRCTGQADAGAWYYEVLIVTSGVMQIGWATKQSKFLNHDGYGIGDDEFSQAYDGCRQLMWHCAVSESQTSLPRWKPGDILGCFLDIDKKSLIFSLNGVSLQPFSQVFQNATCGFFPAASFMSFQQCEFNFGGQPFRHPPSQPFSSFNQVSVLSPEDKVILPRPLKMAALRRLSVKEDACNLCYDRLANTLLLPCKHKGICDKCAIQLDLCPMCRCEIDNLVPDPAPSPLPEPDS